MPTETIIHIAIACYYLFTWLRPSFRFGWKNTHGALVRYPQFITWIVMLLTMALMPIMYAVVDIVVLVKRTVIALVSIIREVVIQLVYIVSPSLCLWLRQRQLDMLMAKNKRLDEKTGHAMDGIQSVLETLRKLQDEAQKNK